LNAFESIDGLLNTEVNDIILPAYCWEQSNVPSPGNIYWTEAAAYGGGLEFNDPVFGSNWTKYWGAHAWFDCDPELHCECERHNCLGTHSMEGDAPAAAASAKPAPVPLVVIEPPTATPSEIHPYNWRWKMCLIRCHVRLNGTPSSPAVCRGPGHHHGTRRPRQKKHRVRATERGVCTDAGGIDAGGTILPTDPRSAEDVRSPSADNHITETDYTSVDTTVPASRVRSLDVRATTGDIEGATRRSQDIPQDGRNRQGSTTGTG